MIQRCRIELQKMTLRCAVIYYDETDIYYDDPSSYYDKSPFYYGLDLEEIQVVPHYDKWALRYDENVFYYGEIVLCYDFESTESTETSVMTY